MSQDDVGPDRDETVGSLTEEATRLLGALGDWARDQNAAAGGMGGLAAQAAEAARQVGEHVSGLAGGIGATADDDEPPGTGGPDCHWCPLCRTAHLVRQAGPEVREQLAVAATALLQAGSGILASLAADSTPSSDPGDPGDPDPRPGPRRPGERGPVERIDLDEQHDGHDDGGSTGVRKD